MNKPAGMSVHPGAGIHDGTVNDWVQALLGKRAVRNDFAASVAHRLDRETSGVLLIALRRPAMRALSLAFEQRTIRKTYLALVKGRMPSASGHIERPLSDDAGTQRQASTHWEIEEALPACALLRIQPTTGRKHQIRRHLAAIAHTIAGDTLHGDALFNAAMSSETGLNRLFLHASELAFLHPRDGTPLRLNAPLAPELVAVLERLRQRSPRTGGPGTPA